MSALSSQAINGTQEVADLFRSAMGRFAASVTLVTTIDEHCCPHGLAATAFSSVSMDPASALVCVNRSSSASPIIKRSGLFCVNMLQREHEALCAIFSKPELRDRRFVDGDWAVGENGLRYLLDAQASIFCEVVQEVDYGSHTIFIGNVMNVITQSLESPLVYMGGRFRELAA
ncbi:MULTISPECIES: flavin reductase family protein [unclassified Pseudomonas]|uniref:flavin reductase family protein n=1 Tax=unclassified Pseudomonas TaxID=196821 RepID=UPI000BA488D3|nr:MULTISPECIES: flavin reductase family protein [unclassified Pseudomonas]MCU1723822.1 flavin reductase family protein [Pseudomonas sp. 5P_5.1_Bac1]MCU1734475.1 flavin reductase family protein [Pseudomonas sp. 20P_3.2_Bac4]MCU1745548.1 flavin reductase family protein [Pseudomonas sp. 20P_3.2_Bac5]